MLDSVARLDSYVTQHMHHIIPVQSIEKYIYLKITITNVVTMCVLSYMEACLKRLEELLWLLLLALLVDGVVDDIAVGSGIKFHYKNWHM